MLTTGNPLGTIDQNAATAEDLDAFPPAMQAEWLALEGAALFERHDPACLPLLRRLATEYPTSPRATQAILTEGDWYWHDADWHKATEQYSKVDLASLGDEQRHLYTYRKALAYLKCGVPEKALPLLSTLTGTSGYDRAARYYTAYAHYMQGDYDTAYPMLEKIAHEISDNANDDEASTASRSGRRNGSSPSLARPGRNYVSDGIEPLYYMTQIEYTRGQYDDVIDHAATIMAKRPVAELLPELHRVAGLSHFKKGDYGQARGHLEEYMRATESPNDDALYALGAIQYTDGDLDEAEKNLRQLTDKQNELAQGAYLFLGQIAERHGDMNAAAMAFSKAAGMAYDRKVAETALYNHIVAVSKGGNAPFASSITMLEDFLHKYPDSPYASDVEESLAGAYFHENDYARALAAINRVKNPSAVTLATKQKILYRLGAGEISAGHPAEAAIHLREAASMRSSDSRLADEARLWLGEALYRAGDFKGAASAYREALKGNLSPANSIMARYGLAYTCFQTHDWREAEKEFARVAGDRDTPAQVKWDAVIRNADCLHYLGDHSRAAAGYLKAAKEGSGDTDYAAFRHAVTAGLTDGTDRKMRELDAFLAERRGSKWTSEVLLEAGKTMAALDRPDKAAPYFERLTREYPKDTRSRTGALSLALAYMKQGATDRAESAYRDIIRTWPTSEEASLANDDLRRICAADGRLEEYAQFLSGIKGAPQITPDEMDAITFEAAETAYADNPEATELLEKYVARYPDGRYLANALMDLAEAAESAGDQDKALSCLDRLLYMRDDSPQVPAALFLQAGLLEDRGDREKALASYIKLEHRGGSEFAPEATAGVMRNTDDPAMRTDYARRLLAMGGTEPSDAEEARYYEASGLLHSGDSKAGEEALKRLAENPDALSGAKAAVELGEWYLASGETKKALSVLEAFTDSGSVHAYWLARGFIALADAYHADGNDYLAAEYLKSLRDNYPGEEPDIIEAINRKITEYSK